MGSMEWEAPAGSAANWLEQATASWREGYYQPPADELLLAAQVAALLAIEQRLARLVQEEEK
jgi:hypothetical protein